MPKKPEKTYQELADALDALLARLQTPDIQVDEAVQLYQQGLQLVAKLETVLAEAENTIKKVQLQAKREVA